MVHVLCDLLCNVCRVIYCVHVMCWVHDGHLVIPWLQAKVSVEAVQDAIQDAVQDTTGKIQDAIQDAVQDTTGKIQDAIQDAVQDTTEKVHDAVNELLPSTVIAAVLPGKPSHHDGATVNPPTTIEDPSTFKDTPPPTPPPTRGGTESDTLAPTNTQSDTLAPTNLPPTSPEQLVAAAATACTDAQAAVEGGVKGALEVGADMNVQKVADAVVKGAAATSNTVCWW